PPLVAQTCSLLYRRFVTCGLSAKSRVLGVTEALPITNFIRKFHNWFEGYFAEKFHGLRQPQRERRHKCMSRIAVRAGAGGIVIAVESVSKVGCNALSEPPRQPRLQTVHFIFDAQRQPVGLIVLS